MSFREVFSFFDVFLNLVWHVAGGKLSLVYSVFVQFSLRLRMRNFCLFFPVFSWLNNVFIFPSYTFLSIITKQFPLLGFRITLALQFCSCFTTFLSSKVIFRADRRDFSRVFAVHVRIKPWDLSGRFLTENSISTTIFLYEVQLKVSEHLLSFSLHCLYLTALHSSLSEH